MALICVFLVGCFGGSGQQRVVMWDHVQQNPGMVGGSGNSGISESGGSGSATLMLEDVVPVSLPFEGVGGDPGFGLEMLRLLATIDPQSPEARLRKELVGLYYEAAEGLLDDALVSVPATVFANLHISESNLGTFLDGFYESGEPEEDWTLRRFNSTLVGTNGFIDRTHTGGGPSVWYDARGHDGYPDGPFQIENGSPGAASGRQSNLNGVGVSGERDWDALYFPDNLAWINFDASVALRQYGTYDVTSEELVGISVAKHARGSFEKQSFGIPYEAGRITLNLRNFVDVGDSLYRESFQRFAVAHVWDLVEIWEMYRPPVVDLGRYADNPSQRAVGTLLLLKAGWNICPGYAQGGRGLSYLVTAQGRAVFDTLWPEHAGEDIVAFVEEHYVKNPWDVIGIGQEDYARIYGLERDSYSNYYNFAFVYKVTDERSHLYLEKMPDGSDPFVVHAWDNVPLGYTAGVLFLGEYNILQILLTAGLPVEIGEELWDATNPRFVYDRILTDFSYDPRVGDGSEVAENFYDLLRLTGISVSGIQEIVLYETYRQAGHYYWYGGAQLETRAENYARHRSWANNEQRRMWLSILYASKGGVPFVGDEVDNEDLLYYGVRLFDCSALVSVGVSLGHLVGNSSRFVVHHASGWFVGIDEEEGTRILEYEGEEYDMSLRTVAGPASIESLRTNLELVPGGLQSGDILANQGHVLFVLGVARRNVVLSMEVARRNVEVVINVGDLVALEAWSTGEMNGIRVRSRGEDFYVVRPYAYGG